MGNRHATTSHTDNLEQRILYRIFATLSHLARSPQYVPSPTATQLRGASQRLLAAPRSGAARAGSAGHALAAAAPSCVPIGSFADVSVARLLAGFLRGIIHRTPPLPSTPCGGGAEVEERG